MTITTVISDVTQSGDGLNRSWTWNFLIPDDESLQIIVTNVDGAETIITSNFTVSGIGAETGGTLTYPTIASGLDPLSDTDKLTINRVVANTQPRKIRNQRRYDPQVVEAALDRLTMQVQQNTNGLKRAIKTGIGSNTNPDELINSIKEDASSVSADKGIVEGYKNEAEVFKDEAEGFRDQAQSSATSAANSVASIQNIVDSLIFDPIAVTVADSPITALAGKYYIVDTSGGAVTINMPSIAVVGQPTNIGVRKATTDLNAITVNPNGADTIDGASSYTVQAVGNITFLADDLATDDWKAISSSGGLAEIKVDTLTDGVDFTAGTDDEITLSFAPSSENSITVTMDGVTQHHDTYSVSGTTLTFDATIPASVNSIEVRYAISAEFGVPNDTSVSWSKFASSVIGALSDIVAGATQKFATCKAVLDYVRDYGQIQLQTSVATTSGTAFDFTGIPSGVNRVTVNGLTISGTGADDLLVRLGSSGVVETAGYLGYNQRDGGFITSTSGFPFIIRNATRTATFSLILTRQSGNTWIASAICMLENSGNITGGSKTLSGELDRIRLAWSSSDTFDGGSVSISWEF